MATNAQADAPALGNDKGQVANTKTESESETMKSSSRPSFFSRRSLLGPVNPKHCDLVLLSHCFVTGLVDASTFNNWAVFVGMQTGNTVILALSTANLPTGQPYSWLNTLVAICSFLVGSFATARLSNYFSPLRRVTITINLLTQGLLILVAAALVTARSPFIPLDDHGLHSSATLDDPRVVTAIPLLAFQSGAQITTSRLMGFEEIPVNVLTSMYAQLMGDPNLFAAKNVKRNRRVAAVVLVLGGAFCAAWIMRMGPGIMLSLWIGAGVKIAAALAVGLFVPGAEPARDIDHGVA